MKDGTKRIIFLLSAFLIASVFAATTTFDAITAATVNKVAITTPATSATLTIPDGVTLTGPASSGTAMTLGNTETVTGVKTFGSAGAVGRLKIAGTTSGTITIDATAVAGTNTLTLPAATDTLVGRATTDTLTNKTISGASNTLSNVNLASQVTGVLPIANGGSGTDTQPSFIAYNSNATFAISTGANKLVLNAEQDDSGSAFDSTTNYRWTPQEAGMYLVGASVSLTGGSNGEACYVFVYKNGGRVRDLDGSGFVSTSLAGTPGSASIVSMNGTTDYIEFYTYITAGTATANGSSGSSLYTCAWGILLKL